MKKLSFFLILAVLAGMLAGCAGTPVVYYSDCTCPTGSHVEAAPTEAAPSVTGAPAAEAPVAEGAVKTGLFIASNISDSKNATAEENGEVAYDLTIVAVNVDDNGVITDCVIDSVGTSVAFDAAGIPVDFDPEAPILTKNELGADYGMVAWGGAVAEWDAQAAALANYAVGKTIDELRSGAVGETGYAQDADLASSATIYLGGYVNAIELAIGNAKHLGAQAGDELKLAVIPSMDASAGQETGGAAQLDLDAVALTMKDGVITSCYIDSIQAKVEIDGTGTITTGLDTEFATKNMLGEQYGMVAWGNAIAEWDQQAASFAAYVTGKTLDEVAGIAVTETTKPAEADLAASVTIAIGGFQALIAKAAQ